MMSCSRDEQAEEALGCISRQTDIFSYTSRIRNHCSCLESSRLTSQRRSLTSAAAECLPITSHGLGLKPVADPLIRGACAAAIL